MRLLSVLAFCACFMPLSSITPFLMVIPGSPPPLLISLTTYPPTTASSHLPFTSLPLPRSPSPRREEEDYLINLLRQEELEAKRQGETEAKLRRAEAAKAEMMAANEAQKRLREARERAQAAEEEELRARMMAKFAEDDRIEQMNAQKRRMKVWGGEGEGARGGGAK